MVYVKAVCRSLCVDVDERANAEQLRSFVSSTWEAYADLIPNSFVQQIIDYQASVKKDNTASVTAQNAKLESEDWTLQAMRVSAAAHGKAVSPDDGDSQISLLTIPWGEVLAAMTALKSAQDLFVIKSAVRIHRAVEEKRNAVLRIGLRAHLSNAQVFVHDDDLLLPVSLLRSVPDRTLRELLLPQHGEQAVCRGVLVINPAVSPFNAHRREKNRRIDRMDEYAAQRQYQRLVANSRFGTQTNGSLNPAADFEDYLENEAADGDEDNGDALSSSGGSLHSRRKGARDVPKKKKETLSIFMRDTAIGADMLIMILSGGLIGYYVNHLRGRSESECLATAAIGMIVMLLVDAGLMLTRMQREDEKTQKERKRRQRKLFGRAQPVNPSSPQQQPTAEKQHAD